MNELAPGLGLLFNQTLTPQEALIFAGIPYLQVLVNDALLSAQGVDVIADIQLQSLPIEAQVRIENFLSFVFPLLLIASLFFNMRSLLVEVNQET